MIKNAERLEFLLHAILNGGKEVCDLLRANCELDTDVAEEKDIIKELESLYDYVKETMSESNTIEFIVHNDNEIKVTSFDLGINIIPTGFGDHCSKEGHGVPVMLVYEEDAPRDLSVVVYDDINQEDHSHWISLDGAKEIRRKK